MAKTREEAKNGSAPTTGLTAKSVDQKNAEAIKIKHRVQHAALTPGSRPKSNPSHKEILSKLAVHLRRLLRVIASSVVLDNRMRSAGSLKLCSKVKFIRGVERLYTARRNAEIINSGIKYIP